MPALPLGSYLLTVQSGNSKSAAFEMAVGAGEGPEGPQGPPGPPGPAGAAGAQGPQGPAGPAGRRRSGRPTRSGGSRRSAGTGRSARADGSYRSGGPSGPQAQGPAGPSGVAASAYSSSNTIQPVDGATANFLTSTPAVVTIAAGQKILIDGAVTLGANATAASQLDLWPCYRLQGSIAAPTTIGHGDV